MHSYYDNPHTAFWILKPLLLLYFSPAKNNAHVSLSAKAKFPARTNFPFRTTLAPIDAGLASYPIYPWSERCLVYSLEKYWSSAALWLENAKLK